MQLAAAGRSASVSLCATISSHCRLSRHHRSGRSKSPLNKAERNLPLSVVLPEIFLQRKQRWQHRSEKRALQESWRPSRQTLFG